MSSVDADTAPVGEPPRGGLVLSLDGYEGPLDLLLDLARRQKVDLARLDLLALVEQYLAYLRDALRREIEVAADHLVMAAWLIWLKSRLLLPREPQPDDEGDPAEALVDRLRRLEAVRRAAAWLAERPRLGIDRHPRGAPEGLAVRRAGPWTVPLYDLAEAHGTLSRRGTMPTLRIVAAETYAIDAALARLADLLKGTSWRELEALLPGLRRDDDTWRRSALASTFVATLELARQGRIELRQTSAFGPVMVRRIAP